MRPIRVSIVNKLCQNNMVSLYLDYYPAIINPDTRRPVRRECMNIKLYGLEKTEEVRYVDNAGRRQCKVVRVPHKSKIDSLGRPEAIKVVLSQLQKNHNTAQNQLAEQIRLGRQMSVNKGNYDFLSKRAQKADFLSFFMGLADKKGYNNRGVWLSAYKQLVAYAGDNLKGFRITRHFVEGYLDFLLKNPKLKQNTKFAYFTKFKLAIKEAEKYKYVLEGTCESIEDVNTKEEDVHIEFLTLDELSIVKHTPCSNALYKQAALFSACTGLRRSDVISFSWGQVKNSNEGSYIDMRQQKTAGVESIGLNDMALEILGKRGDSDHKPFGDLSKVGWATQDKELHKWIADADITKKITFHCFRHTFACALLHKGVDIFRVSKLLGHKSVMTTQRTYAKVLTSDKKKAIDTIKF